MIESAVLGGITGALARLAPEVIKALDRRNERKHELEMNKQQLEVLKVQGAQQKDITQIQANSQELISGINAIKTAYENTKTGFKFADSVSALIRPWVTISVVGFWAATKIAAFVMLAHGGLDWAAAVQATWGENDWAIFSGVTNFWFLGRVFERRS